MISIDQTVIELQKINNLLLYWKPFQLSSTSARLLQDLRQCNPFSGSFSADRWNNMVLWLFLVSWL